MSVRDQAVQIAGEVSRTVGRVDDDRAEALVAALDEAMARPVRHRPHSP